MRKTTLLLGVLLFLSACASSKHTATKLPEHSVLDRMESFDSSYFAQRATGVPFSGWYYGEHTDSVNALEADSALLRPLRDISTFRRRDSLGTIAPVEFRHLVNTIHLSYQILR